MIRLFVPILAALLVLAACDQDAATSDTAGPAMRVDLSVPPPPTPVNTGPDPVEQQSPVEGGGVMVELGERGIRHTEDNPASPSETAPTSQPISSVESNARPFAAGLRAPGTLSSNKPDEAGAVTAAYAPPAGASRSSVGLVQEESPVEGGGVMVNLQGRFMSFATVETNADGEQLVRCQRGLHTSNEPCSHCSAEEGH